MVKALSFILLEPKSNSKKRKPPRTKPLFEISTEPQPEYFVFEKKEFSPIYLNPTSPQLDCVYRQTVTPIPSRKISDEDRVLPIKKTNTFAQAICAQGGAVLTTIVGLGSVMAYTVWSAGSPKPDDYTIALKEPLPIPIEENTQITYTVITSEHIVKE